MNKRLFALFFVGSAFFAPALQAKDLTMTCMEMLEGEPRLDRVYVFKEATGELFLRGYPDHLLASFKERLTGRSRDGRVEVRTYAVLEWVKPGEILKRTVRNVPEKGSKRKPTTYVIVYDFKRQVVHENGGKEDECNHHLYPW